MKANEWEGWVKRAGLMVLIVLFAAASAQAAEGCKNGASKLDRIGSRTSTVDVNATPSDVAPSVLDKIPHLSKSEPSMSAYLALHCEAVSRLLLGEAMRAYNGPACGAGRALQ